MPVWVMASGRSAALVAASTPAAAAVSIAASSTISDREMATRPITGSSTTRPMVSTSTGAGSVNTTAPEATVSHTSPSASLWVALRLDRAGSRGSESASAVMGAPFQYAFSPPIRAKGVLIRM